MRVGMAAGIWKLIPGEHPSMLGRLPIPIRGMFNVRVADRRCRIALPRSLLGDTVDIVVGACFHWPAKLSWSCGPIVCHLVLARNHAVDQLP